MLSSLGDLQGGGNSLDLLLAHNCDLGVLRPFIGNDGRSYVTLQQNGRPVTRVSNTAATLSYDSWKYFDEMVVKALNQRVKAWSDLRMRGLELRLPNGMAQTLLQYQTQSSVQDATVSMRPSRRGEADRPTTDTATLPIPLVHFDFDFDARELAASRLGNMPLDTTMVELAGIKIGEALEKMTLGTGGDIKLNGANIYGYCSLPTRLTKTDLTVPTGSNGTTTVTEVLAMRQSLINRKHYGPYVLYCNLQWAQFLDNDFSTAKGDLTLRQRLLAIEGINDVQVSDFLTSTNYTMVLVEMNSLNARAIIGTEVQTVQWDTLGGMMRHFKVLACQVPHVRADQSGSYAGVCHGTDR